MPVFVVIKTPPFAWLILAALLAGCPALHAGDRTWVYAVEVHATVQASPAQVTLQWPTDEVPATV